MVAVGAVAGLLDDDRTDIGTGEMLLRVIVIIPIGTVAATTAAGAAFTWLRRRSGSIVAPMLAHLGTNSTTFALSWAAGR